MSQSDSSSQSIPKTLHPTAKSSRDAWKRGIHSDQPILFIGKGKVSDMYSILLILHTALENKTWPAGTVGMTFAKVESVVHKPLVCDYRGREIIKVKVP